MQWMKKKNHISHKNGVRNPLRAKSFGTNHHIQQIQQSFPSQLFHTHTSPSDDVSCTLTQSSAAARCSSSFLSIRVTAHVRNREQSIHHLTSLHNDDTAGRKDIPLLKPLSAKLFFVVAVSGLRSNLKICI